jgi:hypothetical protein
MNSRFQQNVNEEMQEETKRLEENEFENLPLDDSNSPDQKLIEIEQLWGNIREHLDYEIQNGIDQLKIKMLKLIKSYLKTGTNNKKVLQTPYLCD